MTVGRCPSHQETQGAFSSLEHVYWKGFQVNGMPRRNSPFLLSSWLLAMQTGICSCMKRSGITFPICCKPWFKAEPGLSLTLPCASVWKGGGCTLSLSCSLRLETRSCFVLARGTLACWCHWRQWSCKVRQGCSTASAVWFWCQKSKKPSLKIELLTTGRRFWFNVDLGFLTSFLLFVVVSYLLCSNVYSSCVASMLMAGGLSAFPLRNPYL